MKKIIPTFLLLSSAITSSSAQAMWPGNWLLGVSGGWANTEGNFETTIIDQENGFQTNYNKRLESNSFIGGVFGGYQIFCNQFLMGLELSASWQDIDEDRPFAFNDSGSIAGGLLVPGTGWSFDAQYDRDFLVDLTLRFGYQITRCFMPYIRLGAEYSNDKLTVTAYNGDPTVLRTLVLDDSVNAYRFVAGIGAEMPLPRLYAWMSRFSVRAEYDYHSKGGKAVDAQGLTNDSERFVAVSMKPTTNSVIASLVWNFI